MRVLIDDTFATKTYTVPITLDWVSPPNTMAVALVAGLTPEQITSEDAALVPSASLPILQSSHDVLPGIAVIADAVGAVAMRTPERPDDIEATPVRLIDASGTAELLARATIQPFYGIPVTNWLHDDRAAGAAQAQVAVVEGAEALRDPEAGFSEDLSRAWFILTAQPVVSHVMVVPRDLPPDGPRPIVAFLDAARGAGIARRRDWRPQLADDAGVGRDRASTFWAAQRLTLEAADRRALLELLTHGSPGTSLPAPLNVRFREETRED